MLPNRIATYLTAGSALAAALAVPIANLDLESSVGVLGGAVVILGVFREWLKGWRGFEWRQAAADAAPDGSIPPGPVE
jgi:hypothetical protein